METKTYIALLRAINVGGRVVKMEKLRALFEELGLTNVRSYIQTGNVFFETTHADRKALTDKIEQHLLHTLGFEVTTLLRTVAEFEVAMKLNPFKDVEITPETRLLLIFISEPLPKSIELPIVSPKNDFEIIAVTSGEVYAVAQHKDGKASNPIAFLEKTYKIKATARFFGTAAKILEAAKQL